MHVNLPFLQKLFARYILESNPFRLQLAHNCTFQAAEFMNLLSFASLNQLFIQSACDILKSYTSTPSAESACLQLKKHSVTQVDAFINQYIRDTLQKLTRFSKHGRRKPATVAIDFHDDCYYGDKTDPYVVGGKRKAGTNRFHRYATVFLCEGQRSFTLGVLSVDKHTPMVDVVTFLINQARKLVNVRWLLGDAGLYTVAVIEYLLKEDIDFVIRGRRSTGAKPIIDALENVVVGEGAAKFLHYTMHSKRMNQKVRVRRVVYREGRALKVLVTSPRSPKGAKETLQLFQKRFGIETSYRMKHHVKAKTCSKNAALRTILFGMSVFLYNLWKIYSSVITKAGQRHRKRDKTQKRSQETRMAVFNHFVWMFILSGPFLEVVSV